jgi:muramidase (phage lysozyme)
MNPSVPAGAAILLDFIAGFESEGSYTVIYGHHENSLLQPITSMTIDALIAAQKTWGKRWGSSAAGRYQFMPTTLTGLKAALNLKGTEPFAPDLQDTLGYQLLKQRGYAAFMARQITTIDFGKRLAMEWASLPVLDTTQGAYRKVARGETYYAGDRLNRALVAPEKVEAILARVHAAPA